MPQYKKPRKIEERNLKSKEIIIDIIIFILLMFMISGVILPKEIYNLDELWNFNFARHIANDKIPYKDFNMVTTPLLPIIAGIILKLFGTELLVMRILAVILSVVIFFTIYKILKYLNVSRGIIYFSLLGLFFLCKKYLTIDYNFAVLFIILLTIYIEIKNIDNYNTKHQILLGILVGSSILLKQTTGIFFTLIFIFYNLLIIYNKNDWKQEWKRILYRGIGALIPLILFCLYLTINNIWYEFIDYTILGIKTFSNKISYINLLKGGYGKTSRILSMAVPIFLIFMYIKTVCIKIKNKRDKIFFVLFCYSIASLIAVFPISDNIHFLIGIIPTLVSFIYTVWSYMLLKIPEVKVKVFLKYFIQCASIIFGLYTVGKFSYKTYNHIKIMKQYNEIKNYKYIKCNFEDIKEVDQFILNNEKLGKQACILDSNAVLYMIPLDKCNKDYDLFLKGNLGKSGEEGQIEKLKNENNTIVLILNIKYAISWQNPEKVRKYIIENWDKTGEILYFDIYEKGE